MRPPPSVHRGSGLGSIALTFWRTFGGLILPLALRTLLRRGSTAPLLRPRTSPASAAFCARS
ncbi:hypothetical protein [Streptomyces sp. NPDC048196]|uniref:hypothetical protein n=1 Tax=Streptomyces sp. NPDC048196 TaxID=3154712 RepID=UPI0033F60BAF